jgi:large subunit ribosomal protein L22
MEFRAELRYLRVSPQKARLVLDLIKGRKVEDARNTLAFTKKRVAAHVGKLLQSALDNANFLASEKNIDVEIDNLYVKRAVANEAHSSRAAGTRLPLPAPHRAHRAGIGGARQE